MGRFKNFQKKLEINIQETVIDSVVFTLIDGQSECTVE